MVGSSEKTAQRITRSNITLDTAQQCVRAYNEGVDGCVKNSGVDRQAREIFPDGLGCTKKQLERQLEFIGQNYGGAGPKPFIGSSIRALSAKIAADILTTFTKYEKVLYSVSPVLLRTPIPETVKILYRPFVQGKNRLVWATKFWHFCNHDAFPIEDSRVDVFLGVNGSNPVDRYLSLCEEFRKFALGHQNWLPELWQTDGRDSCCENKLWDKVYFGAWDLNCQQRS